MKTVLIIGAGQFGIHIAKKMNELNCEIMAVDSDEGRINDILPLVTNAQIGDSTNETFMRSLGIPDFDVCIVTISSNFQNSLETTALLKDLGARKVIARAQNDVQQKFLLRNGADETVSPEKQTAYRLATKDASRRRAARHRAGRGRRPGTDPRPAGGGSLPPGRGTAGRPGSGDE